MNFSVSHVEEADRPWVLEIIRGWGADFIVSRGRKIFAADLPAFMAESNESFEPCPADVHICRDSADNPGGLEASPPYKNATSQGGFEADPPYDDTVSLKKLGLVTYEIIGEQCEVVTLDAFTQFAGVGTALMHRVIDEARAQGCRRVWLITTNDNLDAIRFYQKRGFTIAAVHVNAIAHSRTLKPSIPLIGNYGIPIRDEVEFEMWL